MTNSYPIGSQITSNKLTDIQAANSQVADSQVVDSQVIGMQDSQPAYCLLQCPCDVNLDHAGSLIAGVKTGNRLGNTKLPALCERAMYT